MEILPSGKNSLVTGGAGFIGSHLVDRLVNERDKVVVLDNLNSGCTDNIKEHFRNPKFRFHKVDLFTDEISKYFENIDEVWHLAANPDVRVAPRNTRVDLEQNILATYNVLEAMRKNNVKKIIFTSSSTVYGEAKKFPTPEYHGATNPISLYGSSKLACEAMLSAYCHTFGMEAVVFRLANVIGPRSTHGVIYDFINKLRKDPNKLEILGDGNQKKSYIHIDDCVDAMLIGNTNSGKAFEVYNIGSDNWISVKEIAEIVCEHMRLNPNFEFTGGERGWIGDVTLMFLDTSKVKRLGFRLKYNNEQAIKKVLKGLV